MESTADKYTIINDHEALKRFIDWLPELQPDEVYYVGLFARKKYDVTCTVLSDNAQLKRFTATKDWLYRKIRQLEAPFGAYEDRGRAVPQACLALYINVNPRSQTKAAQHLLKTLADKVSKKYDNYNCYQLAMTSIHKSKSRSCFVDIDFDDVEYAAMAPKILAGINEDAFNVLRTRSGFHLLVNPTQVDKQYVKSWYKHLSDMTESDITGDNMISAQGCVQGGHTPTLYSVNNGVLCSI